MSAECSTCGHDLPYDGECEYCGLRDALRALVRTAEFFLVDPDDENYRAPVKQAIEQARRVLEGDRSG